MTARPMWCKVFLIPECGKFLLVESGIPGFRIQNLGKGIRNSANDWKLESRFQWESISNPVPGIWNPQGGSDLDCLTWNRQQLWLVDLASKVWKQCHWGTTFVESSKETGLQMQYFLIHAIDVTSVKVTRWSSVKSYSTGNVTNFSYECLTLVILILLLPAEVESNCIRTAKWAKWLQLHSVLSLLIHFTWHPLPDHPIGLKKNRKEVHSL